MPYDPYNNGVYQHLDEQLGFPHQASGHRAKQHLPRQNSISDAEARRIAAERAARQPKQQGNTRVPPDASSQVRKRPVNQEDDEGEDSELYEDEELSTRPPRSAVRYQPLGTYLNGMNGLNVNYASPPPPDQRHAIPPRRSAHYQQEPTPQRERYHAMQEADDSTTKEIQEPPRTRRWLKPHWLIFVGVGLLLMLAGYMAFSDLGTWWQTHQDDAAFGNPRTFQIDTVVGHGDSNSNPSHFIALNLKGDIVVLELPGGNVKKAISYPITTLPGNQGNPPVRLVFQDFDHDGKLDLLVQIGDPPTTIIYMLFNNGTQFVGKS